MKKITLFILLLNAFNILWAQENDSLSITIPVVEKYATTRINTPINEVTNPLTIITKETVENSNNASIMPILTQQVPGLFINDIGIAGYGISTGGSGNMTLRGFSSKAGQILVLIDGHPQYTAIYGHPIADSYLSNNVESVEVIRGASSVLYGSNAMGGSINIKTKKQDITNQNIFSGQIYLGSYGTTNYSLNDDISKGKFSANVGMNYEHSDGYRENSEFESMNGHANLAYKLTDIWNISATGDITKFTIEMPGSITTPMNENKGDILRGNSELSINNNYKNILTGNCKFFYNWGKHIINDGYKEGGTPQEYLFHSTDYLGGLNLFESISSKEGTKATLGFDATLYGGNAYRNPETEIYADHVSLTEEAGYAFLEQRLKKCNFTMGFRGDYHELYGFESIPQAGFSYHSKPYNTYKLSYSKGFRSPTMKELFMYGSANQDLLPEHCNSFDFTITHRFFEKIYCDISVFYTHGDNMIETIVDKFGKPKNYNTGEFSNAGIEFAGNYMINKHIAIVGNYSYLSMKTPIIASPRQKAYVSVQYTMNKISLHTGIQYVDHLYLATGENEETNSFAIIDVNLSYALTNNFTLFATMQNAICDEYQTMLGYPLPKTTGKVEIKFNFDKKFKE